MECNACVVHEPVRAVLQYEKAASILSKHDPPIVLAKVDANDKKNKDLSSKYEVQGFPTIKILRNQGDDVQEYNGPRDADGIVEYLKKQVGPASVEITTVEDATYLIGDKGVVIVSTASVSQCYTLSERKLKYMSALKFLLQVGVFPAFAGSQYENFLAVAEKMRNDYDFLHTMDASILPRGDKTVGPVVRLFKPFDELFVDSQVYFVATRLIRFLLLLDYTIPCNDQGLCIRFSFIVKEVVFWLLLTHYPPFYLQDFDKDTLQKFIEVSGFPTVVTFDSNPTNHKYLLKYFDNDGIKVS